MNLNNLFEAANPAQQAAIAISMKKAGKKPKNKDVAEEKVRLDPKCWTGKKIGNPKTKVKGGVRVNNCVPAESINEFAPPGGDDREPNEEEILRQLAAQWWLGTEQQMAKAQRTLEVMGWEIGQDESGDDDAGVFLIRAGDEHGDTYIAFNHSDLEELNEGMSEGSQRVDSLVTDALKIMRGSEANDAVAALKTVLGDREYNSRRGFYNFYVRQILDMSGQQGVAEGAEDLTPNWVKYVLDQLYNSNGAVTMTDLFDEGIPGLRDMFMATAEELGLDPDEDFMDVESAVLEKLDDIIKGGHGVAEGKPNLKCVCKTMGPEQCPVHAPMDEGWLKNTVAGAAIAGAALGAQARVTPDGQGGYTGGLKPTPTVTQPTTSTAPARIDAPGNPSGFSKEYLQKASDPNRTGRYLISVEKAQQLLKQMQEGVAEGNYHANRTGFARGARDDERHDLDQDTRTWYIRLNGKLIKDKQGNPYTFRGKAAANKAALTMQAKLFNQGKEFVLTTNPNDKPQGVAEGQQSGYGRGYASYKSSK